MFYPEATKWLINNNNGRNKIFPILVYVNGVLPKILKKKGVMGA